MITTSLLRRRAARGTAALAAAGATAAAAFAFSAAPADAAPAASTAQQPATIRVAHLSPDMPGVDIYIRSFSGKNAVYLSDATYGDIGKYEQVPAGTYTFTLRKHGASMSVAPLQTWSLTAKPGYAYTAAEVGVGAHHKGVVFNDDLTPPKAGDARVRLIQASSRAGDAQVTAEQGPVVAKNAAFASSTGYASIKAGTWTLKAQGDGNSTTDRVSVPAGSVTSVVLLDAPKQGITLDTSVDAAGAAAMPSGGIQTGGGATAKTFVDGEHSSVLPAIAGGSGAALLVALAAVGINRRRRGATAGS